VLFLALFFLVGDSRELRASALLELGAENAYPDGWPYAEWLDFVGDIRVTRTDRWFKGCCRNHAVEVNKFLLHTTEGGKKVYGASNTLDANKSWPHFIIGRDKQDNFVVWQYLPLSVGARALNKNNDAGVIQVEICGKAAFPFTDDADLTSVVHDLWQALSDTIPTLSMDIDPRISFVEGNKKLAKARINDVQEFRDISGLVGHQHAPENNHWDPGAIDACAVLTLSSGNECYTPNPL